MELVSRNYDKTEDELLRYIEKSDYISFDLEMTGIENDKNNSLIDTPENRYLKYKLTSEKYAIIQLGISFFIKKENPNNSHEIFYECYPFNLYLFPNSRDLKDISQDSMNLEIKCMLFNRKGNIDFNKWINEGIHYLNERQYRELYKNITENNLNNDNFNANINHLDQKTFDYELAQKTIDDIKENFLEQGRIYSNSYIIDCMPKFLLYYIKNQLPQNLYFQENYRMKRNWCTLITGFKSQKEKEELYKIDILSQLKELDHKKGAKKLFDALFNKIYYGNSNINKIKENCYNDKSISRKKILIGHNMSLDLLFIISKLGDKLPDDYNSFKQMIKNNLECIYDTKYLFEEYKNSKQNNNNIILKDLRSVLDNMYPYLKSSYDKFLKIQIKSKENLKEAKYHSAGYDSYITGACFLYMKYAMENEQNFMNENKNKIYLMNSLYKCMDINKDEDEYIMEVTKPYENNIFVFRGIKKVTEICFETIFGRKFWDKYVVKVINEEKKNISVIFTNFIDNNSQDKTVFKTVANSKLSKDKFTAFTLGEFRNKYMKKPKITDEI